MTHHPLVDLVATDVAVREALADLQRGLDIDSPVPDAFAPVLLAALGAVAEHPVVAVTATTRQSEDLAETLSALIGADQVALFPSWETLPHERLSPTTEVVGRRLALLRRLRHPDPSGPAGLPTVVVAPIRAMLQPIVAGLGDLEPLALRPGDEADPTDLAASLVGLGYTRVDLVERRGQFALRGGILDVFPPIAEHPVRVDFFGDEVEEIRFFAVADQRSMDAAPDHLWAPACRELPLTDEVRSRAADLAREHADLAEMLLEIADGRAVEGMEALSSLLADRMELLPDLLPDGSIVISLDSERIAARAEELQRTSEEFLAASWHNTTMADASVAAATPVALADGGYRDLAVVRESVALRGLSWLSLTPFSGLSSDELDPGAEPETPAPAGPQAALATASPTFRGDLPLAAGEVARRLGQGDRVVVLTRGSGVARRLAEAFTDYGVAVSEWPDRAPEHDRVAVGTAPLDVGFRLPAGRLLVLSEADVLGSGTPTSGRPRMPARRRKSLDIMTLRPGDHIVHEKHGVGRYVEMVSRTVSGTTREYLVVEYAPSRRGQPADRLFLPTDQLDSVSRYVGAETPKLSKMGGEDWARAKGKARKAVREIAGELVRLYRRRQESPGHAFGADTTWQAELEESFDFVETPDQAAAIDEVKADMERPIPMDRVVCGDVGYGKTEIAVRAAFKAIQDGKQVALLVPTTLLVQQHHKTFRDRYAAFPVTIAALSRFTAPADRKAALAGIADGSADLVIGTHSLLAANVRFKDLGLVIVDEEQRFGVEHKEHLKALRANVDFLTMSATPIPRTLEMAVTGIREMSTIATPPEERLPVLTSVGPYDRRQVSAAIRRELLREGQVFFVHNRVRSIEKVAAELREAVPEARVAVAHGQMGEGRLEQIILDFWHKQIDVLVCTTIVESGIDIANANTLIVDRADAMGLSQLHQLRGRVGRGRDRAYAYFMYPADSPLSETAHDRLATIAANTDLGAGMQIAMKDLEIRGAGNLLGGEQSGHIAEVGFDLYVRMVGEALADAKGETVEPEEELTVQLPVDAMLPDDYIDSDRLRLEAYRTLAAARDDAEVDTVVAEWIDRYGPLPEPARLAVGIARLRVLAHRVGLTEVTQSSQRIRLYPVELPESRIVRMARMYRGAEYRPATRQILITMPRGSDRKPLRDAELLDWLTEFLTAIVVPRTPSDATQQ